MWRVHRQKRSLYSRAKQTMGGCRHCSQLRQVRLTMELTKTNIIANLFSWRLEVAGLEQIYNGQLTPSPAPRQPTKDWTKLSQDGGSSPGCITRRSWLRRVRRRTASTICSRRPTPRRKRSGRSSVWRRPRVDAAWRGHRWDASGCRRRCATGRPARDRPCYPRRPSDGPDSVERSASLQQRPHRCRY